MSDPAKLKARARLALRAERAFGLKSIKTPNGIAGAKTQSSDSTLADDAKWSAEKSHHRVTGSATAAASRQTSSAETIAQTTPAVRQNTPMPIKPADGPRRVDAGISVTPPTLMRGNIKIFESSEPFTAAPLASAEKILRLKQLDEKEVTGCTRCRLCETRTHTVFGEGTPDAKIFIIGEGPGATEDETGRPFVGRAGALLDKQISAMGLCRADVFIANIVKCRPPGNRDPAPDEISTCASYLERQLEIIRPKVIITLGLPATRHMLQIKSSMSSMRGKWQEWRGIKLMPTFHPAYLLRSYSHANRAMVWNDLQLVMTELNLPLPAKKRDADETVAREF